MKETMCACWNGFIPLYTLPGARIRIGGLEDSILLPELKKCVFRNAIESLPSFCSIKKVSCISRAGWFSRKFNTEIMPVIFFLVRQKQLKPMRLKISNIRFFVNEEVVWMTGNQGKPWFHGGVDQSAMAAGLRMRIFESRLKNTHLLLSLLPSTQFTSCPNALRWSGWMFFISAKDRWVFLSWKEISKWKVSNASLVVAGRILLR